MIKRYIVLIAALALFACAPVIDGFNADYYRNSNSYSDYSEYASDYTRHPNASEYQGILDGMVSDGCPGMAVLVTDEYGVWAGSAGVVDFNTNVSWQNNTICRIGSVSKTFCATLILLLQEDGLVDLDTPLNEILSAELLAGISNTSASVRQLLNHTSGIPNYTNTEYMFNCNFLASPSSVSPQDALDLVRGQKADFAVGTDWNYSNTNYVLAEMIIEKVSGQKSHLLLKEKIFDPLNLDSSYYNPDNPVPEGLARGYFDLYGNGIYNDITRNDIGFYNLAGGIISTVFDLNTFINALFNNRNFLSEQSFKEMNETFNSSKLGINGDIYTTSQYGLGFIALENQGKGVYGHSGSHMGYSARMYYLEESKKSVIVLCNSETPCTENTFLSILEKL